MKKILSVIVLALAVIISFTSCDFNSKPNAQTPSTMLEAKDTRPVTITVSPSEFSLSDVKVEKNEDGGDCSGKGNLIVGYDISLIGNEIPFSFGIHGFDCFNRPTEAKDALARYKQLQKTDIKDIGVTYQLEKGTYVPVKVEIKQKTTVTEKGKPGKLQPPVLIWQR